jgi:YbbR domain-containing protein
VKIEKVQRHTLKILSVLIALTLWFYVLNSEAIDSEQKIKVKYILPKNMVFLSFSQKEVKVRLRGSKAFIENIFSKRDFLKVDLRPEYKNIGKNFRLKFLPTHLELPLGVDVLDISPKETLVELDHIGELEVPIKLQFVGTVPNDRKIKEFKLSHDSIMISGPITLLKALKKMDSLPVNLGLINKDEGTLIIELAPLDPRLYKEENFKLKLEFKTKRISKG